MTEMISQCPKCMTSFRVTEDQLTVAGGKVRCGYCMNVFMGQDYLISGGEQGIGVADEDVLRSLLDGDDNSTGSEGFDPPLASGIESHHHYDIDDSSSLSFDNSAPAADVSVAFYDEPIAADAAPVTADATVVESVSSAAETLPGAQQGTQIAESGVDAAGEFAVTAADDIFSEVVDPLESNDGLLANAEGSLLKADGSPSIAEGSTRNAASDDLIEPDLSLIEESLKFDEDDLRNSTDEDWALELLAELEGTGKYKDSTEASDAYVKELLADTESTLHGANAASSNASPSSEQQSHSSGSGLGFEEIVVDAVPPSDEDDVGEKTAASQNSILSEKAETDDALQAQVSTEKRAGNTNAEFSAEFSNTNAAPALGQSTTQAATETELESAAAGDIELTTPQQGGESDLFEDPSSVYQQSPEPMVELEPSVTAQAIDELIIEEEDEPKRRKTDFLPQDIDISQSSAAATTAGNFLEWKWIAGALGMVLLMLVQYSYFYWDDLTASAKTRPMFESVCNVFACELPPYRNLRNIKTDQLSVRSHPDSESALIVDIILSNKAELAQPFPVLQLTFFDIRSQAVATRKFFPNEYLDGELRGLSSMPSDSPIRLALEIMDPGADAINYELNLLPTL